MEYEFIIDARREDKDEVKADIDRRMKDAQTSEQYHFYFAKDRADAERHVRISVFIFSKQEICYVVCGDFTGQVAAGLIGARGNKCMAILDYSITEDVLKSFPGRDFKDLNKMLNGEVFESDMIKINDDYSLNVCTVGMSAMMAKVSHEHAAIGLADKKAWKKAFISTLLTNRYNKVSVKADGKKLNGKYLLHAHFANGQWSGVTYHGAPDALMDDGLLDVALLNCVPLITMVRSIKLYKHGTYTESRYGRRHSVSCRAKHIELDSDRLVYVAFDGEISASTHFDIEVLPKAVKIILPSI